MSAEGKFYEIEFKPGDLKDMRAIDARDARRVIAKIEALKNNLAGASTSNAIHTLGFPLSEWEKG